MIYTVRMEQSGRIVVPAEVRARLGLVPGQDVTIRADGEDVRIVGSRASVLRRIQAEFERRGNNRSLSEELLAERRAEAESE